MKKRPFGEFMFGDLNLLIFYGKITFPAIVFGKNYSRSGSLIYTP